MDAFQNRFADSIIGQVTTTDRMIFKGHLSGFFPQGAFERFLWQERILLKDFGKFVKGATDELKAHAEKIAKDAGRPFEYLKRAMTKKTGKSKEDYAREIMERDGVKEGLVCVFSTLEPCKSFEVRGNRQTHRLEVVRAKRKCLHFYFYYVDAEFGFMHVRLQSWFPFEIQIYINGREWLSRELARKGIGFERYDNTFTSIDDLPAAQRICERHAHRMWPGVLNALARQVNPWMKRIQNVEFGGYYWVLDQCEIASDIMFRDRATLERLLPDLREEALLAFSPEAVMRFLGRKLHGNFKGEATTDLKRRPEGWCIKHQMKRNSIKMYDKASVLRIETTINNPREFKVLRVIEKDGKRSRRWMPMGKGVANFWRYIRVGTQANHRYLDALGSVELKGEAVEVLDDLCRSHTWQGRHIPKLHPVAAQDAQLLEAVAAGEHMINGFRNADVQAKLYETPPSSPQEGKRRCARVSRLIAKLRGHGLVRKVPRSRLYRATPLGVRLMLATRAFRNVVFPKVLVG